MVQSGVEQSREIIKPLLERAEKLLSEAASFDDAKSQLSELVSEEFVKAFGEELFERTLNSDALGRSNIVQKDKFFSDASGKQAAKFVAGRFTVSASGMNWFAADDVVRVSFDLTPHEAVKYMREKSFWIAGVENQRLLDVIQTQLEQALKNGTDYKVFAQSVRETIDALGYSGDEPLRLGTVYRTNLFGAYSVGQREQVEQVRERFPMWRYIAIKDSRTRASHLELDGKVFRVGEGPVPPIEFNCRCSAQYLHETQVSGLEPWSEDETEKFMKRTGLEPFDMEAEFREWQEKQKRAMSPEVRKVVEKVMV